jgi:hypothetical protein
VYLQLPEDTKRTYLVAVRLANVVPFLFRKAISGGCTIPSPLERLIGKDNVGVCDDSLDSARDTREKYKSAPDVLTIPIVPVSLAPGPKK